MSIKIFDFGMRTNPALYSADNTENMIQRNIIIKEIANLSTCIKGGVLPEAEQVRYWAGKIMRHSAELSRSPKSKI